MKRGLVSKELRELKQPAKHTGTNLPFKNGIDWTNSFYRVQLYRNARWSIVCRHPLRYYLQVLDFGRLYFYFVWLSLDLECLESDAVTGEISSRDCAPIQSVSEICFVFRIYSQADVLRRACSMILHSVGKYQQTGRFFSSIFARNLGSLLVLSSPCTCSPQPFWCEKARFR